MPKASVKVMRSYDYCHFECALSSDDELSLDEINDLRRQAAILVDEAVREYRIAKKKEDARERHSWELERAIESAKAIKEKPKSEWSVDEAAFMRGFEDKKFWKEYDDDAYSYEDDPSRDHHFSMLYRFKGARVKA